MSQLPRRCAELAAARRFQAVVIGVIIANAVILALETFDRLDRDYGEILRALDTACVAFFVVEITIRIVAHGSRPLDFFRSPANVFDFVVTAAALFPAVGPSAALLRVLRVLRVARLLILIPDLRVVVRGLVRSVAPIGAVAVLTVLVLFLYGMLGVILFEDVDPAHWGNIGEAMLTLFAMLTFEGWIEVMEAAEPAGWWA